MADEVNPTAGENENLIVNLDEEDNPGTTQASSGADGKPPPVPSPSAPPAAQEGLAELNRQVEAERAERVRVTQVAQQIARERDEAVAFAQEAERRGVSTYELYNENQIKAVQDKMIALSNGAEQAMVDGDFKRAQALNLEIGRLGGNLAVLERDQAILTQQREQAAQQARQRPQQAQQPRPAAPVQPTDPLERAIQGKTEAAKEFIRKHPEIVRSDGTIKRVALDAHERALDEGHRADSPGYFEYIERSIMAQQPQNGGGNPPPRGAPTLQHGAAPVSRGGSPGGGGGGGNGTFVMTPKMRRLAEEQGVEPREWARNYVRLLAEGRITPIT
jgi:hypothetical protein